VVGQAHGHGEQAAVAGAAAERDRGLDQVTGTVHLVAPGQPCVLRLAADLEVGVQVTVRALGLREQRGDLGGEGRELGPPAMGQLPADRLQGLVDVGVHKHRAAVAGPGQRVDRADPHRAVPAGRAIAVAAAGLLPLGVRDPALDRAVGLDGQPHVLQVARGLELAQRERQAGGQVALLPLVQQAAGQAGAGQGAVRLGLTGCEGDGSGYATGWSRGSARWSRGSARTLAPRRKE
jgi:hypothetical protein